MIIEMNENGQVKTLTDFLWERNQNLIEQIAPRYNDLYQKYKENLSRMKPQNLKWGGQMTQYILTALSRLKPMSLEEYASMTWQDLSEWYTAYMDFLCNYTIFEIPSTRQLFCAYMGISVNKFIAWLTCSNEDLKEKAIMINDDFNAIVFANAESSNNNASATLARGKIKDAGQGMVANADEISLRINQQAVNPQVRMIRADEIAQQIKKISKK